MTASSLSNNSDFLKSFLDHSPILVGNIYRTHRDSQVSEWEFALLAPEKLNILFGFILRFAKTKQFTLMKIDFQTGKLFKSTEH
jgi:hypothetical protein